MLCPDKLMRVRIDHPYLLPEFVEVYFLNPVAHELIIANAKSSAGQNGVSGTDLKFRAFPLPPVSEQREIVRRVGELSALADRLEVRVEAARQRVEGLTQSILAKASGANWFPPRRSWPRRKDAITRQRRCFWSGYRRNAVVSNDQSGDRLADAGWGPNAGSLAAGPHL